MYSPTRHDAIAPCSELHKYVSPAPSLLGDAVLRVLDASTSADTSSSTTTISRRVEHRQLPHRFLAWPFIYSFTQRYCRPQRPYFAAHTCTYTAVIRHAQDDAERVSDLAAATDSGGGAGRKELLEGVARGTVCHGRGGQVCTAGAGAQTCKVRTRAAAVGHSARPYSSTAWRALKRFHARPTANDSEQKILHTNIT
ncbi:hypothetical protein OH76DRAFT_498171 [Lentinus brumalis]|uniref:Uncharacterized protein n=1 Tax=Lentinus brumalis TaxID=2498619 RepID=A0A371DBL5_9APHY|nr:hypothetical protein OH76DRAFT_498171 [Polyporus brumalis]